MARQSIADILKAKDSASGKGKDGKKPKKSSADRKRLTIGSAKKSKPKIPKITKVFRTKKDIEEAKKKAAAKKKAKEEKAKDKAKTATKKGKKGKDFLDDDYHMKKSDELVTRKGILGLNLISTAETNRKLALEDDSIEQRGGRRYRVTEDGVKVKMKKVTKRRNSKNKGKKLKKFIENDEKKPNRITKAVLLLGPILELSKLI